MPSYSLSKVVATITGPGGSFQIGAGAGVSDEGIEIETNERSVKQMGADGVGQWSFLADKSGRLTLTLLKTSPVNAQLMAMFHTQSLDPALWGQNVITVVETSSGSTVSARQCAFTKVPTQKFAKEAGTNEWEFESLRVDTVLGVY
jgi:hypothetical protein